MPGTLLRVKYQKMLPVALCPQHFKSNFVEKLAWPYLVAATTVTIVPVIVLCYVTQKTLVEGISISGIKA